MHGFVPVVTLAAADPVAVPAPKDRLAFHSHQWANLDASKRRVESVEGAFVLVGFEKNPAHGLLSGALLSGAAVFVHIVRTEPAEVEVVFECHVKSVSIEDGILVARLTNAGPPKEMKAAADGIV